MIESEPGASVSAGGLAALDAAAMLASGCATPHAPSVSPQVLSADQVERLFEGRTVTSRNLTTGTISVSHYESNGQVQQSREGRARIGTWRVLPDGRVCLTMQKRSESCRWVRLDSDGQLRKYKRLVPGAKAVVAYDRIDPWPAGVVPARPWREPARHEDRGASRSSDVVKGVQQRLVAHGYAPGPIDGIWGPRTIAAWQRFQDHRGLTPTRIVDRRTLGLLHSEPDPTPR